MNRNRWVALAIALILIVGGVMVLIRPHSASAPGTATSTSTTTTPSLASDLYPLYSAVEWHMPQAEQVTIGTTTYSGTSISSIAVTGTMDPGGIFTPFEQYYAKKLGNAGWRVDKYLAAGGHVGGQTGYTKSNNVVLTRFHIDYHTVSSTSPSECPCDVTLSLFSGS